MDASATNSGSSDGTVRCVPQPEQSQQGSLPLLSGYSEQPSERFGNSHCYPSGQTFGLRWRSHARAHSRKNAEKHGVNQSEAEEIFFNEPLLVLEDSKHSQTEARFHALGETDDERLLHITFTLRQNGTLIRVISARDMHRKERAVYEQVEKDAWV